MEINEQIRLRFGGVDFPNVELNSTKAFVENEERTVDVEIQPMFFAPKDVINAFKIVMKIELSVKDYFNLKIVAVGHFELSEKDVDEEMRKLFINVNAPAIMFPYVRSFISTLTSNLGNVISPIILPARFFKGEMEEITDEHLKVNK